MEKSYLKRKTELLVLSSDQDQLDVFLAGVRPEVRVEVLEPGDDVGRKIRSLLARRGYERVHLLGHGSPGAIMIGGCLLQRGAFKAIRPRRGRADPFPRGLCFWSCMTGRGLAGALLMRAVASRFRSLVYASQQNVGHGKSGGTWNLKAFKGGKKLRQAGI